MEMMEYLKECGRVLVEQRLTWGQSGNISARVEPNLFLISAGGTDLGALHDEDLPRCRIDREEWEGARRPSMETGFHRGIYRTCEDAGAVIHSQPFYSTLVACSDMEIRTDFLPEAMAYLDMIERVPYHHAGSRELAEAITARASAGRVLLLNNHGVVCWAPSLDEALLLTQTLEFCCRLLVTSRSSNISFKYLGRDVVEDFHRHLREIGR
jgi:L-fuculose-phosphate aldolase